MIAGHFATGMALSAGHPSRGGLAYGLLLLGAMLADLMWCVLTLVGIEGGSSLGDLAQHRPRLPWSHSLVPTLIWTVLYAGFCLGIARAAGLRAPGRLALLAGLAVVLHWLVGDLPVGTGFFLTPAMQIEVPSLHLYAYPSAALLLEAIFCVAAWAVYARSVGGTMTTTAVAGLGLLIGLHVVMSLPSLAGNPNVNLDEQPIRILAYLVPSIVAISVFTAVHALLGRRAGAADGLREAIPWWGRVGAKLVLARLPANYAFWKRLGLFEHGDMERPEYALEVFRKHFDRARPAPGFVFMELGPGDSLNSGIISRAFGARRAYLVDSGAYAHRDLDRYRATARLLVGEGLSAPDLESVSSSEALLEACEITYLTGGLSSLQEIPDGSVEFIYSHAVLEHIRHADFAATIRELRRIVHPSGICSHQVDLRDHLGGALNNLRFRRALWESEFMARSGFYTNRIRYTEMLGLFERSGFRLEVLETKRWNELPTPRRSISSEFAHLSSEELCVSGFSALLRPV